MQIISYTKGTLFCVKDPYLYLSTNANTDADAEMLKGNFS